VVIKFNVLDVSPLDLAKQITLLDHSLFAALDLRECLHKDFMDPEKSPTFSALTKKFNEVLNAC
jgi:hypothetical protein